MVLKVFPNSVGAGLVYLFHGGLDLLRAERYGLRGEHLVLLHLDVVQCGIVD